MARHENTLSTLQARTILSAVRSLSDSLSTREEIEKAAFSVIDSLSKKFPVNFPNELYFSFVAFALSACAKEGIKRNELTILDYLSILASVKEENESNISDFGAFGDLFEILVRCAFMRKISLVRWSVLSVKAINTSDITSKRFGVVEVGHNGKTLSFGTLFDYMDGDYNSVVYGVFSEDDKKEVYALCKNKEYEKAIDYIANYSAYWSDKYEFQKDMDNLTRGKGITAKGANIQVVYNEGKYNAFLLALEDGKIKSLSETLKEIES